MSFMFVALTTFSSAEAQHPLSQNENDLRGLVMKMTAAQLNYDPDALDKIYANDFIEISPVGEVDPRAKTIGFYKPEVNRGRPNQEMTVAANEFSIRTYGKSAVVIAKLTFSPTGNQAASRPPFSFRVTLLCRKLHGAWKIVSSQYTGIRLAGTPNLSK